MKTGQAAIGMRALRPGAPKAGQASIEMVALQAGVRTSCRAPAGAPFGQGGRAAFRPGAPKAGQASIEMVALLAGALIIMMGALVMLPQQYSGITLEASRQAAQGAADRITGASEEVYVAGEGAQKSFWVDLPHGFDANRSFIGNMPGAAGAQNRTVGVYVIGLGYAISEGRAQMCGVFPNQPGRYLLRAIYNSSGHVMINATC